MARVPADTLNSVVEPKVLFAVGFKAIVFAAAVLLVVCVLSYLAGRVGWNDHAREWHAVVERGPRHAASLIRTERPLPPPRLGNRAVQAVAGFNVLVISAIAGLAFSKLVEEAFPNTSWVVVAASAVMGASVALRLASWGPLRWGAGGHGVALAFALFVAFFASAPIGVLVLASVAIARFARVIARPERPASLAELSGLFMDTRPAHRAGEPLRQPERVRASARARHDPVRVVARREREAARPAIERHRPPRYGSVPGGPRISMSWRAPTAVSVSGSTCLSAATSSTKRSNPAGVLVTSQRAGASPTR